jgi:hypothetical protein
MRIKGMAYDTGFIRPGNCSREHFDPATVRRELTIIRDDLHCNAVHIVGGDPGRLELAAQCAAELGLAVWFSPYPLELDRHQMLELFADCAQRAERLRRQGADVVFVTGVELTVMNPGFVPGNDPAERVAALVSDPKLRAENFAGVSARLNDFLAEAVAVVREHFAGPLTYACIPFERVDWSQFDYVAVELMRTAEVQDRFVDAVRNLVAQPKPVVITGFGTATWKGSADIAPRSMEIVDCDEHGRPLRINGDYVRDEEGQATYLRELLEIYDEAGVEGTFPFLFALESYPHRPDDPERDLDLAGVGIVKVLENGRGETYPDMAWEPKAAFTAVADYYRKQDDRRRSR